MDRWACISVAALPLQLLLRRHGEWKTLPAVVVSEDKPQGTVLWLNERARAVGVLVGQSYGVALSLCSELRAGVISTSEIEQVTTELKALLWKFSPHVEVSEDAGVFWLDASGLGTLYPELERWARAVRDVLFEHALSASVVVGYSRFGTYAVARASRVVRVFADAEQEREAFNAVPLAYLDLEPELCSVLSKLGILHVFEFLQLSAAELLTRFGKTAYRIHQLATGELSTPFNETPWIEPLVLRALLDEPETDATRLLFVIKRLLDALLLALASRMLALATLSFRCKLDRLQGTLGPESLRPAVPTLDVVQLMDLVRLRIEARDLAAGIIEVELEVTGVLTNAEQLHVFAERPRRDLLAAERALARLRADLGEDAVVHAVLCPAHLPEARYAWQPLHALSLPVLENATRARLAKASSIGSARAEWEARDPSAQASLERRPLVRRIFARPETLYGVRRDVRNDGWLIRGMAPGPVAQTAGPFVVSGGWWLREVQREYQYALTQRGDLLWVYHDRKRRRLFLHGEVQ